MYSDSSTLRTLSNTRIGRQGSSAVNDSVPKVPQFSSPRGINSDARKGQVTFARFIETRFIPDHITHKSRAGQTHYYSILKHAVRPETVTCLWREPQERQPETPLLERMALSGRCSPLRHHTRACSCNRHGCGGARLFGANG